MTNRASLGSLVVTCAVTVAASAGAGAQAGGALAAPVFPDAVELAHQGDREALRRDPRLGRFERLRRADTRAFLTEAEPEAVRGFYEARGAGRVVSVHGLERANHTQGQHGEWTSIGPFLKRLYTMADTCSEDLAYVMVRSEYSHLATGFYQLTDQRAGDDGRRLSRAEVLYRDCERRLQGQNKLWNKWKACLAELDDYDYRTLIVIDQTDRYSGSE